MTYDIIIDTDAFNDLEEIINWYEMQQEGLGLDLLSEFNQYTEKIMMNPKTYEKYYQQFRKALLNRFPYAIYYGIDETLAQIKIIGIYHSHRNPKVAKKRIKTKW